MKEFTLDDDNILWSFFDEMNISYSEIFETSLQKKLPQATTEDLAKYTEEFIDDIHAAIEKSGIKSSIKVEAKEEEVEEGTGLWGHFTFKISNEDKTKKFFEKELESIMIELIKRLMKKGRFKN
jgi:hypothetical protein